MEEVQNTLKLDISFNSCYIFSANLTSGFDGRYLVTSPHLNPQKMSGLLEILLKLKLTIVPK